MAIEHYNRDQFIEKLKVYVSASQPVRSIEHLYGRSIELQRIDEALQADGRHVFIFGDRGVGKSSLAASAATQYQSSDNRPISIGCGPDTTFYGTIEALAHLIITGARGKLRYDISQKLNVLGVYTVTVDSKSQEIEVPKANSMFAAVEATKLAAGIHSKSPIVVIDEFDQISRADDRKLFASYLKGLGDSGVNIKFIFTGVASSLDELLGHHESSFRQLHTEPLGRVDWTARMDIVRHAADAFGLSVDDDLLHVIARISNGFPYYVHLITERLLWEAFGASSIIPCLDMRLFKPALASAIASISAQLQRPYDKATLHRSSDYRDIVWATADSESDFRSIDAMFKSYLRIHKSLYGEAPAPDLRPLSKDAFSSRITSLRKDSLGKLLEPFGDRRGMYSYRENILRGFVAMKAFEAGVELRGDVPDEPKVPTALGRIRPFQAGQKDWTPKGIKFRGEKRELDEDSN